MGGCSCPPGCLAPQAYGVGWIGCCDDTVALLNQYHGDGLTHGFIILDQQHGAGKAFGGWQAQVCICLLHFLGLCAAASRC